VLCSSTGKSYWAGSSGLGDDGSSPSAAAREREGEIERSSLPGLSNYFLPPHDLKPVVFTPHGTQANPGLCTAYAVTYSPDTTWRPRAATLGTSLLMVDLAGLSGLSSGCAP
jgi:hypothetical protein